MNDDTVRELTKKVLASRAGREVSPDVVLGAVQWALARWKPAEAERRTRGRLHQLYGSYVVEGWLKTARAVLDELSRGACDARTAAERLLALHGSTRERAGCAVELYEKICSVCGRPRAVLDVACGLNPVSLFLTEIGAARILALDAGKDVVDVLNRFFSLAGMAGARALACDALQGLPEERFNLALILKFLPLAERMERGGALKVLRAVNAGHIAVSFPTRSLGGRNVGMERNYAQWFESLGYEGRVLDRFVLGDELVYVVEGKGRTGG